MRGLRKHLLLILSCVMLCLCVLGFSACRNGKGMACNGCAFNTNSALDESGSASSSTASSIENSSSVVENSSSIEESSSSVEDSSSSANSSSSVEAHEHAWEEVSREEPTCTEDGKIIYECECGETKEEKISLLGHNMIDGVCERCAKSYSEGLEYVLNADNMSYLVKGIGACTDTEIIIPVTYNDLPVTRIGGYAFLDCRNLTSVVIPDSVTTIGEWAFLECSSLTSVVIGGQCNHDWLFCVRWLR